MAGEKVGPRTNKKRLTIYTDSGIQMGIRTLKECACIHQDQMPPILLMSAIINIFFRNLLSPLILMNESRDYLFIGGFTSLSTLHRSYGIHLVAQGSVL